MWWGHKDTELVVETQKGVLGIQERTLGTQEWVLWIQSRFWVNREGAGDTVGPGGHRSGCSFSRIPW